MMPSTWASDVRLRVDAQDRLDALEDERSVVRPSSRTNNVITVHVPEFIAQLRCAERKRQPQARRGMYPSD